MALTKQIDSILGLVLDSFKVKFPMLTALSLDLGKKEPAAVMGDTIKARVRGRATVRDYDGTSGYEANAADVTGLMEDVPVTLNRHKHVPVMANHLDLAASRIDLFEAADEIAYELGREAIDHILSVCNTSNFSQSSAYSEANSDKDMLDNIAGDMNQIGARATGRFGIVNTNVYNTLEADSRVASKDYAGQNRNGTAYGHLSGISGFENIWEYPALSTNNGSGATFTADASTDVCTSSAHGYSDGQRVQVSNSGGGLPTGLAAVTDYYVRDATTDTFKLSATDGGSAIDITGAGTGTHTVTATENLTGFFGTSEGIVLASRALKPLAQPDPALGRVVGVKTVSDPDTGLSFHMLDWVKTGRMDIYRTITWLYGVSAGRQAESTGAITDYGGHRLITA